MTTEQVFEKAKYIFQQQIMDIIHEIDFKDFVESGEGDENGLLHGKESLVRTMTNFIREEISMEIDYAAVTTRVRERLMALNFEPQF